MRDRLDTLAKKLSEKLVLVTIFDAAVREVSNLAVNNDTDSSEKPPDARDDGATATFQHGLHQRAVGLDNHKITKIKCHYTWIGFFYERPGLPVEKSDEPLRPNIQRHRST